MDNSNYVGKAIPFTPAFIAKLEFAVIGESNKGNKINAIKALRDMVPGMGLKEAKDFVEAYQEERIKAEQYADMLRTKWTMRQKLNVILQENPELGNWIARLNNEMDRM